MRDEADAAKAALATVEAALEEPEAELRRAQKRVAAVVKVIMAGAIEPLMAEIERLQSEAGQKRSILAFLLGECFSWPPSEESKQVNSFLAKPIYSFDSTKHPALEPWRAAQEALAQSADAPLPVTARPGLQAVT
jgi:hypothetical protein